MRWTFLGLMAVIFMILLVNPAMAETRPNPRLAPPEKPGPPPEDQIAFMKLCRTGSAADIRAAIQAGADPNLGLSDLAWPAILGYRPDGLANWQSPLIKAGQVIDLYEKNVLSKSWNTDWWQVWGPRAATTPLMVAAYGNPDPAVIKILLEAGADPNIVTSSRATALNLAAAKSNPKVVAALLDGGAEANPARQDAEYPLMWAAKYNPDPAVTTLLLDRGARPEPGNGLTSPIDQAAIHNRNLAVLDVLLARLPLRPDNSELARLLESPGARPEALLKLLKAGASAHGPSPVSRIGYMPVSPLVIAARFSANPEIMRILIQKGAEVNRRFTGARNPERVLDREGISPLAAAATRGKNWDIVANTARPTGWNPQIAQMLLENGARVTPADLLLAVGYYGEPEAIRYLAKAWREQNPGGDYRALVSSLVAEAINGHHPQNFETLLNEGADAKSVLAADPDLALTFFTERNFLNSERLLPWAAEQGLDLNRPGQNGQTPLTKLLIDSGAYIRPQMGVAKLLAAGADPNLPDARGMTPLIAAMGDGRLLYSEHLEMLLAAGADPNLAGADGQTPLMAAAALKSTGMLERLLAAGADPLAIDHQGRDALMLAAAPAKAEKYSALVPASGPERVRLLLAAGADPQRRDHRGFTALAHAAAYSADPAIIDLLVEAGSRLDVRVDGDNLLDLAVTSNPNPYIIKDLLDRGLGLGRNPYPLVRGASLTLLLLAKDGLRLFGGPLCAEAAWWLADGKRHTKRLLLASRRPLTFGKRVYVAELLNALPPIAPLDEPTLAAGLWPLLNAAPNNQLKGYQQIRALIRAGADVEERDEMGRSPLIYVAQNFQDELALATIQELLRAGADPKIPDQQGMTALMYAARFQKNEYFYKNILNALIQGGADIEARDPAGHTALMQVLMFEGQDDHILRKLKVLQALGADIHTRDNRGATLLITLAFMVEVGEDSQPIIQWLLEQGLDPRATDNDGLNAAMASAMAWWGKDCDDLYAAGLDPGATDNHGRNALMHLFRQFPKKSLDDFDLNRVNPGKVIELAAKDAYGLNLLEQVLFSHASLDSMNLLVEEGLSF